MVVILYLGKSILLDYDYQVNAKAVALGIYWMTACVCLCAFA